MRPEPGTYPHYYDTYISLVKQNDILTALTETEGEVINFFKSISPAKENYAYATGKWTVKDVLCHINDTERIFAYRCLRFARKDPQQVLSYEQDAYVANSNSHANSLANLIEEFYSIRQSTISLFKSFNNETLLHYGKSPSGNATVISIGFTICGHALHHINVVKERYL